MSNNDNDNESSYEKPKTEKCFGSKAYLEAFEREPHTGNVISDLQKIVDKNT